MFPDDFQFAVSYVINNEGGYVDNPADPGGPTKYGITKRGHPNLDIKNLTRAQAESIYFQDWWLVYRYGSIGNRNVATKTFDTAVSLGPAWAHKMLQAAAHEVGVFDLTVDGVLGPKTLQCVNASQASDLLRGFVVLQVQHYEHLVERNERLKVFLNGWLSRARKLPGGPAQ